MDKWINTQFESSSGTTEEFAQFARDYKRHLKQVFAGAGLELVNYNRGHFYISGFVKNTNTGKLAYFSTDDVRWSDGWLTNVLVRTAEHERDFRGGSNSQATLPQLGVRAQELTA